jgi:ATP-binding protein involved in chromosome partitioning
MVFVMPQTTTERILDALRNVNDPELNRDLVSLNMVKNVAVCEGLARVEVELTTPACPLKDTIRKDVTQAVMAVDGVERVEVEFSARVRGHREAGLQLPGVKNVIAIGAGKGGVGKSTIAVIAAYGLARAGAKVGLMDADVYGPSLAKMCGLQDMQPTVMPDPGGRTDEKGDPLLLINPLVRNDVKIISLGNLIRADDAMIVRGPIVHGTVRQLLGQTYWGELDYLIVDLPPGTGDVPLTLAQSIPVTGGVIVCTPQEVAIMDAVRAMRMYEKLNIPTLGMVENMSYFIAPDTGVEYDIFGKGGVKVAAAEAHVPFLGAIPINIQIRRIGDLGRPIDYFNDADPKTQAALESFVSALAARISIKNALQPAAPTAAVSSQP